MFVSRIFDLEWDILKERARHIEYVKRITPGHECVISDVQRTEYIIHDDKDKTKTQVSAGLVPGIQSNPSPQESDDEKIFFGEFKTTKRFVYPRKPLCVTKLIRYNNDYNS